MTELQFVTGGAELLDEVAPLWEKLRDHHARLSPHFGAEMARVSFAERWRGLLEKVREGGLRVDVARTAPEGTTSPGRVIGYCISSVDRARVGEIESIFVEEGCRGRGVGERLLRAALAWLEECGVDRKILYVASGNEEVFGFYERHGFYPQGILLREKGRIG